MVESFLPDAGLGDDSKRRFLHEAQVASSLNHPNIVTIYEISLAPPREFITTRPPGIARLPFWTLPAGRARPSCAHRRTGSTRPASRPIDACSASR